MKKNNIIVLYDSEARTLEEARGLLEEWRADTGSAEAITDADAWQELEIMCDNDAHDFQELLKAFDNNIFNKIIITGSVGTWRGRFEIDPVAVDTLTEAINMINNRYIEDIKVYFNDRRQALTVEALHHDGRNIFKLYKKAGRAKIAIKYKDFENIIYK